MARPRSVDADLSNADWTKRTWDIRVGLNYRLVQSLPDLFLFLGVGEDTKRAQQKAISQLRRLPVWGAAPESLKQQVEDWWAGRFTDPESV